IDVGRYFVPEREKQIEIIRDMVPAFDGPFWVWELGCGEGLLAEAILEKYPGARVRGLDGSVKMLEAASGRLARYGERFVPAKFDLFSEGWRNPGEPVHAVVS